MMEHLGQEGAKSIPIMGVEVKLSNIGERESWKFSEGDIFVGVAEK